MIQCYLVNEDENEKINSQETVFKLLVKLLDRSLRGLGYNGVNFAVIEVIEVTKQSVPSVSRRCIYRNNALTVTSRKQTSHLAQLQGVAT